jgi:hypothetical protein
LQERLDKGATRLLQTDSNLPSGKASA